jgi:hypothetical protein
MEKGNLRGSVRTGRSPYPEGSPQMREFLALVWRFHTGRDLFREARWIRRSGVSARSREDPSTAAIIVIMNQDYKTMAFKSALSCLAEELLDRDEIPVGSGLDYYPSTPH